MKEVSIYTDGACSGNPGNGGWAAILVYNGHEKVLAGAERNTTNNRMELTAAIKGLKALKRKCTVKLYSDSTYLVNGFSKGWVKKWSKNGWVSTSKEKVKNIELWKELDILNSYHRIVWEKVKGHSNNKYNNRCDKLAVEQIKKYRKSIEKETEEK
jgi:ribonuclease HI